MTRFLKLTDLLGRRSRREETPTLKNALDSALNELLHDATLLCCSLQNVPHYRFNSLAHYIALDINRLTDLLRRENRVFLSMSDEHDPKDSVLGGDEILDR